jgi:hypothetical protein
MPELEKMFRGWSREYQQERDLGAIGEFVGLYRKARKLKTVFKDGVDPRDWRESLRTIVLEVAAHALLLAVDIDNGDLCSERCRDGQGHVHDHDCFADFQPYQRVIVSVDDEDDGSEIF